MTTYVISLRRDYEYWRRNVATPEELAPGGHKHIGRADQLRGLCLTATDRVIHVGRSRDMRDAHEIAKELHYLRQRRASDIQATRLTVPHPSHTMNPYISATYITDKDGNPAGGQTRGTGIQISWQMGPVVRDGKRLAPNGAFVEGVLQAALDRLEYYQTTKFKCDDNADAIQHITDAIGCLNRRTRAREERGVEGTHAA